MWLWVVVDIAVEEQEKEEDECVDVRCSVDVVEVKLVHDLRQWMKSVKRFLWGTFVRALFEQSFLCGMVGTELAHDEMVTYFGYIWVIWVIAASQEVSGIDD